MRFIGSLPILLLGLLVTSQIPSGKPTSQPSSQPTRQPTSQPSSRPSGQPTSRPTALPSIHIPTQTPTLSPLALLNEQTLTSPLQPVSDGPPTDFYPLEFDEHVFSAIILVLCAGISSHLCFGYSTKKSRETFIGLILLIMMGFQLFHLLRAALYVPASRFSVFNKEFHRSDCLESVKGGKKPFKSMQAVDKNPCFCVPPATCFLKATGLAADVSGGTSCPIDGSAYCLSGVGNATEVKAYISHFRNCIGGQGPSCTRDQPCFPCARETLPDWSGSGKSHAIARCRTCSTEFSGDCNFIPDVGPFCYDRLGSKNVVPCKRCCTEPDPLIVNGTCY